MGCLPRLPPGRKGRSRVEITFYFFHGNNLLDLVCQKEPGLLEFQPRLFFNAPKSLDRNVFVRMLDGGAPFFDRMLVLVVASCHIYFIPTVCLQHFDNFP